MTTETNILDELTAIRSDIKSLAKIVRKIRSTQEDPNGEKSANRAKNNGFNREQKISDELRAFLGVEEGKLVSRSFVTRAVNKYVKDNNLKHPDNGRVLVLDAKLRALLNPPPGEQITYLNLQKFLSPHYVKDEA